jgi:hypothetical protein
MRKCVVVFVAALAVLSFTLPSQASAQSVFLGAGATIPTGDYKDIDEAKTGWMVEGGFGFPLGGGGLYGFVEGLYGSNKHEHEGDKTNLLGGFGGIEYVFAEEGEAGLFVFGEVGFLRHSYKSEEHSESESSDSGIAFGGGAGYSIPFGESMNGWILGRYLMGKTGEDSDTSFIGIMAGVSIPIGGEG